MRAVVQRVSRASVSVAGETRGEIEAGLLVLLAIHKNDREEDIAKMVDKISKLRIFKDSEGKMNLSVADLSLEILVISQFTLYGDCRKGNRPSFIESAEPERAEEYYEKFISTLKQKGYKVASGVFGGDMALDFVNDGPVTLILDIPG